MFYKRKKFELSPRLKFGVGRGYPQNKILKTSAILCLVIALGLTINAFRIIFSGTNAASVEAGSGEVLGATDTNVLPANSDVQFIEYKVKTGDTLFNLSQTYNINWTTLATLNNLKSPFTLKVGQTIRIPK